MDLYSTEDMYDSFQKYQGALLQQFDRLAEEFNFHVVDARPEPKVIFEQLREGILRVLVKPEPPLSAGLSVVPPAAEAPGDNAAAPSRRIPEAAAKLEELREPRAKS
jgi:hypothetical protein